MLGGIGKNYNCRENIVGSSEPVKLWLSLHTSVQQDVLKNGNEVGILQDYNGLTTRQVNMFGGSEMLKRFAHTATVHMHCIIIFGGCRGKFLDQDLKLVPAKIMHRTSRCSALRDVCIFDTHKSNAAN